MTTVTHPVTLTRKNRQQVEPGTYIAVLKEVRNLGPKDYGFGTKDVLELLFDVGKPGADGLPLTIGMLCTQSLDFRAKLSTAVAALNGGVIPETLTINTLIGRTAQITVGLRRDKHGRDWSTIKTISQPPPPAAPQYQYQPPAAASPVSSFTIPAATESRQ